MSPFALLAFAILLAPARPAGDCPFTACEVSSFGTGTGVCSTSTLQASFTSEDCRLALSFAPDDFICGNTFLTQHLLIVGIQPIPAGVGVGPQFIEGSRLYVVPLAVIGPLPGASSSFKLPSAPALLGLPFYLQAAPTFVTTVSLPIVPETGLSSALELTLL
ncbi:MAG TPA: hypothetical protein VFD43_04225 [Planctomycetota bacterium]|nr:hypothetical protein [Planctomycetota bacterium]